MKISLRYLLIPCLAMTIAAAQPARAVGDDATRILHKMRQVDLLNQILPVLMTPEQLQKLLPAIEKARKAATDGEKAELEQLKKMESKLDTAIKDAKEKSLVPTAELQKEIFVLLNTLQKIREAMVIEQNEAVLKAVEETLDAGQIKAAANALSVPAGETKPTDRDKLRRWVRAVLMDPLAYDVLVELSRKK